MAALTCTVLAASCTSDAERAGDIAAARAAAVQVLASGCPGGTATGGGSYVDDGLVLTVAHVVAGSSSVHVIDPDGVQHDAEVAAIDRRKDLAVLRVGGTGTPLPFGDLRAGAHGVLAVWRDGAVTVSTFRTDAAVDIRTDDIDDDGSGRRRGYAVEATVLDGDSGSVLVADGRAVGVVFARSAGRDGRAWAVDIDEAVALLTIARTSNGTAATGSCAHRDRDDP